MGIMGKLVILIVALAVFSLFGLNSPTAYAGSFGFASVSIDDVSMEEGDDGTTDFVFTVSAVCEGPCDTFSIGYSTEADTATQDDDYNGVEDGLVTLSPNEGGDASGTITIQVNGDTDFESDEIFFVNLFDCGFCTFLDSQGEGTIENDDAEAQLPEPTLYGIGFFGSNGLSQLYTIDVNTGDATPIGDGIGFQRCSSMDFDPVSGILYAICERDEEDDFSVLITIDTSTGVGTEVGRTFAEDIDFNFGTMTDMSFRNSDGVLYAHAEENDEIVTIDITTGLATDLSAGSVGGFGNALAFSPVDTLYLATGGELITIDQTTGDIIDSVFNDEVSRVNGMDYDPVSGVLYGIENQGIGGSDRFLVTINVNDFSFPTSVSTEDGMDAIAVFTTPAPLPLQTPGAGGQGYEGPTLGEFDDGRLIVSDGFCFDRVCLDVLDYFNHLPIQQVDSGTTHTISMTAYCSAGSNRCNYASVGAAPPGTDINSVDWNVMLKRTGNSNDWQVIKDDPNGMLGDVTGTVQVVDASRIQYTFNIQFITPASIGTVDGNAEPPEDNMILVTEIRDSKGGVGRNIFNEGVFVIDIYAYPQVDASYLPSVKVTPLCLNEDPTDRNTCAFELVRQWTIKQAEEKLKEIYEQNNYKTD